MNTNQILNKVRVLLGMEVKLERMKLMDGVTVIEADAFEPEMEVFVVTEDDQKIPVPVGEYEMEDGRILVVEVEGIVKEVKEKMEEEPAMEEEPTVEVEVEANETTAPAPKKTIESVVKESFFSEIEALKAENETLKAELSALKTKEVELSEVKEEPKPISFNPENTNPIERVRLASKRPRSIMDTVLEKINK
jgi:uncharacterized protein (UPF0179 family)